MVCISRIFADNCAKGAFFCGAAKDNGQEMTKFQDARARRRSTGSEFQSVLELVREGTSPEKPRRRSPSTVDHDPATRYG